MVLGLKVANEVLGPEIKEMLEQKEQQNNNQ
jgi:4-carboxymuconolactone decarboxylase